MKKVKTALIIVFALALIVATYFLVTKHTIRIYESEKMLIDNYCLSTQLEMIEYVNVHCDDIISLSELLISNPDYIEDTQKMNELFSENNLDYFVDSEFKPRWFAVNKGEKNAGLAVQDDVAYWQYVSMLHKTGEQTTFAFYFCPTEVYVAEETILIGNGIYILPYDCNAQNMGV